ncbi:MAG TPA: ribosome-associated translation inhibitor RaiA [Caulobacteraceae bacterium]|jgi:ribosomal subunit interface protein|nr:ribosome-associated translation inhibitor RaiA [Caulobacteraceae bacterium]
MQVRVSGKHVDVGDALRSRIVDELTQQIGRFFEREGGSAEVVVAKEGHLFRVDCLVTLASGQQVVGHAFAADAHDAFSGVLDKIEKRVRRYKRKLKNHRALAKPGEGEIPAETAPLTILRAPDEDEDEESPDQDSSSQSQEPSAAMVVAETEQELRTMTVGMAVLELDLTNYPVILFRNAAHGGLSVVYRRPDGNIGWIDPERANREGRRRSVA